MPSLNIEHLAAERSMMETSLEIVVVGYSWVFLLSKKGIELFVIWNGVEGSGS